MNGPAAQGVLVLRTLILAGGLLLLHAAFLLSKAERGGGDKLTLKRMALKCFAGPLQQYLTIDKLLGSSHLFYSFLKL